MRGWRGEHRRVRQEIPQSFFQAGSLATWISNKAAYGHRLCGWASNVGSTPFIRARVRQWWHWIYNIGIGGDGASISEAVYGNITRPDRFDWGLNLCAEAYFRRPPQWCGQKKLLGYCAEFYNNVELYSIRDVGDESGPLIMHRGMEVCPVELKTKTSA